MKVSGCIITKNEEAVIKRCIDSFKDVVSEIIVVDSGSTDATCQIAQSLGAKVYFREWDGDFSAARNFCLCKASYPYIIFLDADEYFDDNSQAYKAVSYLHKHPKYDALAVNLVNLISPDQPGSMESPVIRIFRRSPKIKYHYKIHEELLVAQHKPSILYAPRSMVLINHTGYQGDKSYTKCKRNLTLLMEELQAENPRPIVYHYISDCYMGLGQYQPAIEYAEKFLNSGHNSGLFAPLPYHNICLAYSYLNQDDACMNAILRAISACPQNGFFDYLAGMESIYKNQQETAMAYLTAAYEKMTRVASSAKSSPQLSLGLQWLPTVISFLAHLHLLSGNKDKAMYYAEKLPPSAIPPQFVQSVLLQLSDNLEQTKKSIERFYPDTSQNTLILLIKTITPEKFIPLNNFYYSIYQQKYGNTLSVAQAMNLMANRRFDNALALIEQIYISTFTEQLIPLMITAYILSGANRLSSKKFLHPSFKRIVCAYEQLKSDRKVDTMLMYEDTPALAAVLGTLLDYGGYDKFPFMPHYIHNPDKRVVWQEFVKRGCLELCT